MSSPSELAFQPYSSSALCLLNFYLNTLNHFQTQQLNAPTVVPNEKYWENQRLQIGKIIVNYSSAVELAAAHV